MDQRLRAGSAAAGRSSTTRASRSASTSRSSADTHRFEFDVRRSASARSCSTTRSSASSRTLHPNHTWEKVVFDPWRQETLGCQRHRAGRDPRTDPDVGDFFARLPDDGLPADLARAAHRRGTRAAGAGCRAESRCSCRHAHRRPLRHARPPVPDHRPQPLRANGVTSTRAIRPASSSTSKATSAPCTDAHGPHRHALRLRHARQPHSSGQHGGGRALDAERCGGQADPRLGQPRSSVPHHLRRAAPADAACSCTKATGSQSDSAEHSVYGESTGRRPAQSQTRKLFQHFDGAGIVTNEDCTTSRATCFAAARQLLQNYRDQASTGR